MASGDVSGVSRMSTRAWAARGITVRRCSSDVPSLAKWLAFTVGQRYGVQTASPYHRANAASASRRNWPFSRANSVTRPWRSSMSRASGSTGFATLLQ